MRTFVYIDGFNLYYRALKGTPYRWLNLVALASAALPSSSRVVGVNYYTARVSGYPDPNAPARQHAYLRALATLPELTIHYGNFLVSEKWSGLIQPPDFRPTFVLPAGAAPIVARVRKTEEKGSDVNLAVHLVRDAFLKKFEMAAVLTNDTDLVEPIRIVTQEIGLPVTLLMPSAKPSASLTKFATSTRHVQPYLGACQFPAQIVALGQKPILKPASW